MIKKSATAVKKPHVTDSVPANAAKKPYVIDSAHRFKKFLRNSSSHNRQESAEYIINLKKKKSSAKGKTNTLQSIP